MFSLLDRRFVLCSRDLDVLRAKRTMGYLIVITHKSTRLETTITCEGVGANDEDVAEFNGRSVRMTGV